MGGERTPRAQRFNDRFAGAAATSHSKTRAIGGSLQFEVTQSRGHYGRDAAGEAAANSRCFSPSMKCIPATSEALIRPSTIAENA